MGTSKCLWRLNLSGYWTLPQRWVLLFLKINLFFQETTASSNSPLLLIAICDSLIILETTHPNVPRTAPGYSYHPGEIINTKVFYSHKHPGLGGKLDHLPTQRGLWCSDVHRRRPEGQEASDWPGQQPQGEAWTSTQGPRGREPKLSSPGTRKPAPRNTQRIPPQIRYAELKEWPVPTWGPKHKGEKHTPKPELPQQQRPVRKHKEKRHLEVDWKVL